MFVLTHEIMGYFLSFFCLFTFFIFNNCRCCICPLLLDYFECSSQSNTHDKIILYIYIYICMYMYVYKSHDKYRMCKTFNFGIFQSKI